MLGVQRSGVSIALADLESRGFISSKRRLIVILSRPALEKFTNGSYGLAEAEYKRRVKRSKSYFLAIHCHLLLHWLTTHVFEHEIQGHL
jgi:DNA-binding transcriptional regulator YhcF (GntR family)